MKRRLSLAWPLIRLWLGLGVIGRKRENTNGGAVDNTRGTKALRGMFKNIVVQIKSKGGGKIGNPLAHLPARLPKKLLGLVQAYRNPGLKKTKPFTFQQKKHILLDETNEETARIF